VHDLAVTAHVHELLDAMPAATDTAKAWFGATPYDLVSSRAVRAPGKSEWKVTLEYRGRLTGEKPRTDPAHELQFHLRDTSLQKALHRALGYAARYYHRVQEHVLVSSRAVDEPTTDRYIVTFTFMGLTS
jgi:hypothetical protein